MLRQAGGGVEEGRAAVLKKALAGLSLAPRLINFARLDGPWDGKSIGHVPHSDSGLGVGCGTGHSVGDAGVRKTHNHIEYNERFRGTIA